MTKLDIEANHIDVLTRMDPAQRLVMAREILASQIRAKAKEQGVYITRKESLEAVFEAEARAVEAGASPKVDFFMPLSSDLPLQAL